MGRRVATGKASLVVVVAASLLMLSPTTQEARAAFPGENGKIAFSDKDDIWTISPNGTGQTRLTDNPAFNASLSPAQSPDGTKIAYTHGDGSGERRYDYVEVMNADGAEQTRLAEGNSPAWSPDGTKLAFVRYYDNGVRAIIVMNADGSEQTRLIEGHDPAWSPDGTKIAFADCREQGGGIFVFDVKTGKVERLTTASNTCTGYEIYHSTPDWSPDGSKLVFKKGRHNDPGEIFTVNADGTGLNKVPVIGYEGGSRPAWSPDGEKIVYHNDTGLYGTSDGNEGIYVMNPDGSGQTAVADGGSYLDWGVAPGTALPPPPPTTAVTSGPETGSEATGRTATFEFASDGEGSTFECSLDNAPFTSCSSPKTFTRLSDGTHVFRVRATDTSGRIDATPVRRTWFVNSPRNALPEVRGDRYSVKAGKTLTVLQPSVLNNDRDPEGNKLAAKVVSRPQRGRLSLASDGSFVYKPRSGYRGRDGFRYRASDGDGGTATARVRIVVGQRS